MEVINIEVDSLFGIWKDKRIKIAPIKGAIFIQCGMY